MKINAMRPGWEEDSTAPPDLPPAWSAPSCLVLSCLVLSCLVLARQNGAAGGTDCLPDDIVFIIVKRHAHHPCAMCSAVIQEPWATLGSNSMTVCIPTLVALLSWLSRLARTRTTKPSAATAITDYCAVITLRVLRGCQMWPKDAIFHCLSILFFERWWWGGGGNVFFPAVADLLLVDEFNRKCGFPFWRAAQREMR